MKILAIDIETSPNLADVWGLWQQNVSLNQLRESSRVLCFAAKWVGDNGVRFLDEYHDGHEAMVATAHALLDEADVALHYNGRRFDIPHLNREFLEHGLNPPAPFLHIDLLETAKSKFRFPSNKLDYVSSRLGLGSKVKHEGHELWTRCLSGDEDAWLRMRDYNIQDVLLLEQLYERLRPWIKSHPSHGAFTGEDVCPKCGSDNLKRKGYALTSTGATQRYVCRNCGAWSKSGKRILKTDIREVAA